MRIQFTERFPAASAETEAAWRLVQKIVADRLAEEVDRRLRENRTTDRP